MPKYYDLVSVQKHFDDLEIIEHIDSGGFKDVFLVEQDGRNIVLKLLPVDRRSRRKRAKREGQAMKEIESDDFVDLIDYFEETVDERRTFVILEEYIPGGTLEEKLEKEDNSLEFGLNLTQTLLELLSEFDQKDMIHRDFKPANIMIDESGEPQVLDVGIVRFEEKESLTPDHMERLGTPGYGAPEQLDYEKDEQSIRMDLFSTGIVMFESITGDHPFVDQGEVVTDAICNGSKRDLSNYVEGEFGEDLQFFFDTLTQPQPNKRYRKPEHALEVFNEIVEGA